MLLSSVMLISTNQIKVLRLWLTCFEVWPITILTFACWMLKTRKTMVSWQAFPSLPPGTPRVFLAPKTPFPFPFPSLSNACHVGNTVWCVNEPSSCVSNYTFGQRVIIHTKKGSRSWQRHYTIIRCDITVLLVFYYTCKKCNFTLEQGVNHSHYTVWCVNIPSYCVSNYTLKQYVIIDTKKGCRGWQSYYTIIRC